MGPNFQYFAATTNSPTIINTMIEMARITRTTPNRDSELLSDIR
jgi:hypothetical protein